MNVAEDAYFTTQYLDRRINSPRSHSQFKRNGNVAVGTSSPQRVSSNNSEVIDPDTLSEQLTPAQLTYLQRATPRKQRMPMAGYYKTKRSTQSYNQNNSFPKNAESFYAKEPYMYTQNYTQVQPLQGYYIDQQIRYDQAEEFKPKTYTHKTFKDIFPEDEDERFNPADTVFVDSENVGISEQKQKIQRAFKHVQRKLGKDDYDSYDYYDEKHKQEPGLAENLDVPEAHKKSSSRWKVFGHRRKMSRKKGSTEAKGAEDTQMDQNWADLDEPLGKDCEDTNKYYGDVVLDEKSRLTSEKLVSPSLPSSSSFQAYNPVWSYFLSWVNYQQGKEEDNDSPEGKIVELGDTKSPEVLEESYLGTKHRKAKRGNIKVMNSKAKSMISKWNQPVSSILDRQRRLHGNEERGSELQLEMEVSSNTVTPQAYRESQSVAIGMKNGSPTSSSEETGLISNIDSLIKSIRLMRIIFAPIDVIAQNFPTLQTIVILLELVIFLWLLYELSLIIDAVCMAVKAICAPMIAIGKFMNRIM
ncbi:hypothetical protein EJF18_10094 [Clavispora lusitaniae]|uniref:Uncharacterized protein n=3 Tax=Clavispora lusitaniae TaxID=36911 RepID=C4XVW0_CLAL4|nr:uncharacterized protein CLUG_00083 [Clavispora lusitaniae ATCC 42720]KAF5213489.1 hypothetical protein E0198_001011 [Clavispora lusitaniae]EEQ35960.1 hypothetical protein CLUG_00083 [Clavispora lusitaniae ATCC 42720]OVF06617.1 hypothetical protein A9F13_19g00132 [Clavispora lusitaniae]QFZ25011.1 hypothetical protein EJF14_10094 [Clavispora lusitaniae]QFZ31686.1 hypothetical protein EJF16_10094 [Clavispora lusitaniae]